MVNPDLVLDYVILPLFLFQFLVDSEVFIIYSLHLPSYLGNL